MKDEPMHMQRVLIAGAWIAGTCLFFRYLLSPLLPFLFALGISAILEPWVQRFRKAARLRRPFAAVVLTTVLLLTVGGAVVVLVLRLSTELVEWSTHLPDAIASFPTLWNHALNRIENWYASCPFFVRSALDILATTLGDNATAFVGKAGSFLMEKASSLAARLPDITLFCITTILALYFTGISYHSILTFLKRQLPLRWQRRCRAAVQCCRSTMLTWLRSELLLVCITFVILLIGFWWMQLPYALLAAFSIALVDALPVLGAGTILLPWALFRFLLGDTRQGLMLIILFAAALLTHSLLEPHLLAGQSNLPPVAILLAMYVGYNFMGVGGMFLLPLLLLLAKQLHDAGVIQLWR